MRQAPTPNDEQGRLQALKTLGVLEAPSDPELDGMVLLAAEVCAAPLAMITMLDSEAERVKSRIGMPFPELRRDMSFCAHAIVEESALEVVDARNDSRFCDHPLVVGEPRIRFYAGAPLVTAGDGFHVGVLCVLDTTPRKLTNVQWHCLSVLSRAVMCRIECQRLRPLH